MLAKAIHFKGNIFTAFTTTSFVTVAAAVLAIVVAFHRKEALGDEGAVDRIDRRARLMLPVFYFVGLLLLVIGYLA